MYKRQAYIVTIQCIKELPRSNAILFNPTEAKYIRSPYGHRDSDGSRMGEITDRQMSTKPGEKDIWLNESAPKGHGRFIARITPSGDRLFYFRYTDSTGKRVRLPLGSYDRDGTTGLTLKSARKKADELSSLYQSGIVDLRAHLEAEEHARITFRNAELARLAQEKADAEAESARHNSRLTVHQLFDQWMLLEISHRKDKGAEVRRMFKKDVLPQVGDIAVEDVTKGQIAAITDALLARGVERMAKVIFSLIRQMFSFAVERDYIQSNPTATINKGKVFGPDNERERILSSDEVVQLVHLLPAAHLLASTEVALWLALSACCRIGEVLGAQWSHINFEKREWFIPANHSKNGKPHTVYLSDFSLSQFERLRAINGRHRWCYPNRNATGSVCPKTVTKQVTDRQRMEDDTVLSGRTMHRSALVLPGGHWTPHDLRRTGASMMVSLGVLPDVADRCMNHVEQNKVRRTYIRYDYAKEMKAAWILLGDELARLTDYNNSTLRTDCP